MIAALPGRKTPRWLATASQEGRMPRLRDMLMSSVFYPACGFDVSPLAFLGGNYRSFVYVDHGVEQGEVLESLARIEGYELAFVRTLDIARLVPAEWKWLEADRKREPGWARAEGVAKKGFALWVVLRRCQDANSIDGTDRLSVLYMCNEGVETFRALYERNAVSPAVVTVIDPGTGWGGNWTDFRDPAAPLALAVMGNSARPPRFLLQGGAGPPDMHGASAWPEFSYLVGIREQYMHQLRLWGRAAKVASRSRSPARKGRSPTCRSK